MARGATRSRRMESARSRESRGRDRALRRHQRPVRRRQEPGEQAVRGPRLLRASTTCPPDAARRLPGAATRTDPTATAASALVLDIRGRGSGAGDPARGRQPSRPTDPASSSSTSRRATRRSVSRFSETRHRHPLQASRSGVQASIAEERGRLARTRELADHVIDTSGLSIGQLKDRLFSLVPRQRPPTSCASTSSPSASSTACRSRPTSSSTSAS